MARRDVNWIAARLRGRRLFLRGMTIVGAAVAVTVLATWIWAPSNDYRQFDRREVEVLDVLDGASFRLADSSRTTVVLLGVAAPETPDAPFASQATEYLRAQLARGRPLLKLDGTSTRDAGGRLLAYVYIADHELLNERIVAGGVCYADRRLRHLMAPIFEQAEAVARKKRLGFWSTITDEQHPEWRRIWLASRR